MISRMFGYGYVHVGMRSSTSPFMYVYVYVLVYLRSSKPCFLHATAPSARNKGQDSHG